jgi:hypothetical protein
MGRRRLLVVTNDRALELDDAYVTGTEVRGTVIRAWFLSSAPLAADAATSRAWKHEPQVLAAQMGWKPDEPSHAGQRIQMDASEIQFVRAQEAHAEPVGIAATLLALAVALLIVLQNLRGAG